MQRAAWEVVGRSYSSAASADGLQGLVLQSAQAVEFGLGSMVLHQADEVGADRRRDRGSGFRCLDAGESAGVVVDGYGDVFMDTVSRFP